MNLNYDNLPLDFQHPGGFVEKVMNYINETAVCPQPLFALGAALACAGTLYGRRVEGEDGQRTNIFVMTVGYTSSGKDHALKTIARIFDSANASHLRLGQVTSDSAIEWALKRQPRFCFCIDEAGHYFGGITESGKAGGAAYAIKPALLELWSSANTRWIGKQRVPKDGKEQPPLVIDNPHLCLYATTQPQILFESLCRNDLRDGWLARNLFFVSTTRPKPVFKKVMPVPNSIRAEVFAWKDAENTPLVVPTDAAANAVFSAFNDEIYTKMVEADTTADETNYLYGKALENARRIALILAVSRDNDHPVIRTDEATYATNLVRLLVGSVIGIVRENLHENNDEKYKRELMKIIAKTSWRGILKGEITRRTQYMRRVTRNEYLEDLVASGDVVEMVTQSGGVKYLLAQYAPKVAETTRMT